MELSLCGGYMREGMDPTEVAMVFDQHRVDSRAYFADCLGVADAPQLWIRIDGAVYPSAQAVPVLLGALAFGTPIAEVLRLLEGQLRKLSLGAKEAGKDKEGRGWRIWPWSRSTSKGKEGGRSEGPSLPKTLGF
mmetsp:Transcript_24347/g.76819  ORF Transcript_24347/g.76819 Transcript_24347/m.76819 type:complete len:134 (+) Transcript_24347:407-808(+)